MIKTILGAGLIMLMGLIVAGCDAPVVTLEFPTQTAGPTETPVEDTPTAIPTPGPVRLAAIGLGECFDTDGSLEDGFVMPAPCGEGPYANDLDRRADVISRFQVLGKHQIADLEYPGDYTMRFVAEEKCASDTEDLFGTWTSREEWGEDNRILICLRAAPESETE